ncbi:sensor histidine kinase [Actinomadura roseirufa]|uniref:sensor histidine kinase n=1 Tax=Actinomadura roseirufa TaxID=2094049 RepID=UPI00104124FC|nr:histidine kinase [Actinomadura roseirufa]
MRAEAGIGRWPRTADWAVPVLLVTAQLPLTWALARADGTSLGPGRWAATTLAIVAAAVALPWRRTAPAPVLAATILFGACAVAASGSGAVTGVSDGVALYSFAVHRGPRPALLACLTAFVASVLGFLPHGDGLSDLLAEAVLNAVLYLEITTFGQLRRQRTAPPGGSRDAAAGIEREGRAAASAERERLARDVHDVAGHHLSGVAVHSGAAVRADDPELTRQALSAAAEAGREVLASLSRLVDVVGPAPEGGGLKSLLPPLCHGLGRLGVPVSLAVEGRARKLPAGVTAAAYRIAQESLTNAMRYASGAPVRVAVRYTPGAVVLTIENEAPAGGGAVPALGGGRGVRGMRERATGLGGSLTAGPSPAGGWTVEARLPTTAGAERGAGWPEILDALTMVLCAAPPILVLFSPEPLLPGLPAPAVAAVAAALALRAVPLWWRRRAPAAALAVLTAADTLWAVLGVLYAQPSLDLLILGSAAQVAAVYSVACYHPAGRRTWPAALVATLPWGVAIAASLAADPEAAPPAEIPLAIMYGLASTTALTTPVTAGAWLWGRAVSIRSRRWEHAAPDAAAARAGDAVHAERTRVAVGLGGTVLDRTARLVRAAEAGVAGTDDDARTAVAAVADQARAALADVRALLDGMEERV